MSSDYRPFNPLDTPAIAQSLGREALSRSPVPISDLSPFPGAGVYLIYYAGDFSAYLPLRESNRERLTWPIYVGKADISGARKGDLDGPIGEPLYRRIKQHRESLVQVTNLDESDFFVRYLVVEPLFIPLGETLLISRFLPVWNRLIDGFGNHDPGKGRHSGMRPRWDVLHPGRPWADRLQPRPETAAAIAQDALEYLRARVQQTVLLDLAAEEKEGFE